MTAEEHLNKKLHNLYSEMKIIEDNYQIFNKDQLLYLNEINARLIACAALVQFNFRERGEL